MADFLFVDNWKWPEEDIVWREEIISLLGQILIANKRVNNETEPLLQSNFSTNGKKYQY